MSASTLHFELPGYRRARNAYWRLRRPEQHSLKERERRRLASFVARGALAFDVGANVGDVTSLLLDIGARVIAIEPNPELAALVRKRFRVESLALAVGSSEGEAKLQLGRDLGHSTVSSVWSGMHPSRFLRTISVPMTTLDALIETHGCPDFVKIDVEGYEAEVLAGLHVALPCLRFEFQRDLLAVTERSLERLHELGRYRFQFATNWQRGSSSLVPDRPTDGSELLAGIAALPARAYGDVYARLTG